MADSQALIVQLHSRLWGNCLDGAGEVLWMRPVPGVNALGFLALHLADARHFAAGLLGGPIEHPFGERFKDARSMDDLAERPGLDELVPAWASVSGGLEAALAAMTEDRWRSASPQRFPVDDPTLAGAFGFLLHHEAYHIGQMGLLRRCFGLPAMSYE